MRFGRLLLMLLWTVAAEEIDKFTHLGAWETRLCIHISFWFFICFTEKHCCNKQWESTWKYIWGCHSDDYDNYHLLGCDVVYRSYFSTQPLACAWGEWHEVAAATLWGGGVMHCNWSPAITQTHPRIIISVTRLNQMQHAFCRERPGLRLSGSLEAAHSSEVLVMIYQTVWHQIPDNSNLHK